MHKVMFLVQNYIKFGIMRFTEADDLTWLLRLSPRYLYYQKCKVDRIQKAKISLLRIIKFIKRNVLSLFLKSSGDDGCSNVRWKCFK